MSHSCQQLETPTISVDQLVKQSIELLRKRGLRRTKALDLMLRHLATHHNPITLGELGKIKGLHDHDQATIYRLMMKLEQSGIVRRIGLHERASYFQMVIPGHHHDYLVCTVCGKIQDIGIECPAEPLEKSISQHTGYQHVYHELQFYGICPDCQLKASTNG